MPLTITAEGVEPPTVTEARRAFDDKAKRVALKFVNESVQATNVGIAQIEAGNYVTLEDLEEEVKDK